MRRVAVAAFVVVLAATGCVPQTPDEDTYRDRTRVAITETISAVETTRLVLRRLMRGGILEQYAEVALRDSENSVSSASNSYTALDPPRRRDALFSSTSTLMSDASSLVTDARIAVVRDDGGRYPGLQKRLGKLSTDLNKKLAKVS